MELVGPFHLALLGATAVAGLLLVALCRRVAGARRTVRLAVGCGPALNELGWWAFRYSHEGLHLWNLPLQLCDVTLWMTALACLTLAPAVVEFAYFAGLAGAAMGRGGRWGGTGVGRDGRVGVAVLVMGGIAPLRRGAVWRALGCCWVTRRSWALSRGPRNQLPVRVPEAKESLVWTCWVRGPGA